MCSTAPTQTRSGPGNWGEGIKGRGEDRKSRKWVVIREWEGEHQEKEDFIVPGE